MNKRGGGGAMWRNRYRKQKQQQQLKQLSGHFKWRSVLFSSLDRKISFYQSIWTPVDIYQQIVWNRDENRFVYANTHNCFPFSYGNINYQSVFVAADEYDLAAANIFCHHRPAEAAVIYQQLEGIPATTSGLEYQEHLAPSPSSDVCDGLDENYGCQREEQGAAVADETSLKEKVIDADTMPAFFSHAEDASTPRSESEGLVDDDHVVSSFFNRPTGEEQFLEENTNGGEDIIEEQFRDRAELKEKNKKKLTKTRMTNGQRKAKMDRFATAQCSNKKMESIAATGSGGSVGSAMSDTSGNMKAILPSSSPAEGHDTRAGETAAVEPRLHGPGRCSAITLTADDRVQQEEEIIAGQDLLVTAVVQFSNNNKASDSSSM
eukprot:gene32443-42032_t